MHTSIMPSSPGRDNFEQFGSPGSGAVEHNSPRTERDMSHALTNLFGWTNLREALRNMSEDQASTEIVRLLDVLWENRSAAEAHLVNRADYDAYFEEWGRLQHELDAEQMTRLRRAIASPRPVGHSRHSASDLGDERVDSLRASLRQLNAKYGIVGTDDDEMRRRWIREQVYTADVAAALADVTAEEFAVLAEEALHRAFASRYQSRAVGPAGNDEPDRRLLSIIDESIEMWARSHPE